MAEVAVDETQAVQGRAQALQVADALEQLQCPLTPGQGLLVVTEKGVVPAHRVEGIGLAAPMARDWTECTAIADAVRRGQTAFMLGMTHHFNPAVAAAHRIVAGGDLGPIVAGSCAFSQTWNWRGRAPFSSAQS